MNKLATIFPCALLAIGVNAATASAQNYDAMHKQLSIMSDIIKSSVSTQTGRDSENITAIESVYLNGQGVIFTIDSAAHSRHSARHNFQFVMPEIPAIPSLPSLPTVGHADRDNDHEQFEVEIHETVAQALESASEGYELAIEIVEEERERSRELRNEQRDLSYEIRDLEREKRDLEFQLNRADKDAKAELNAQVKQLDKKRNNLEKQRETLRAKTEALRLQQKTQHEQRLKERTTYYDNLSTSLAETLCLYGNGLKTLPKNEHVNVIIKAGGDKEGRRYKDKIYVFKIEDINACSVDKIKVAKLLENAKGYQF